MKTYPLPIVPPPAPKEKSGREVAEEIIAYFGRQIRELDKNIKTEPHPLYFSLSTPEEESNERHSISLHNSRIYSQVALYEDLAWVVHNTYIKEPESKIFKDYASNI